MAAKLPKPAKPLRYRYLDLLETWVDVWPQIDSADDRTKAIVACAFVENNLATAILARFRYTDEEDQRFLFEREFAPLSTFSSKIDIGWALNLYGKNVRADLHRVSAIPSF